MKKLLSLLIIMSAAIACSDDDLKPEGDFTGDKIVGFGSEFESVAYFADEGAVQQTFPVNLIGLGNGETSDQPITINYEIVTQANAIGDEQFTTATEGVEFDFVDNTGSITIPAGGTFGMFPLNINTGNLNPTEKTQLVLRLTDASGNTVVGEQYDTLRIVFVGCQSQIEGNYSLTVTRNDGFIREYPSENITMTDVNTFITDNVGTWLPGQLAPAPTQHFQFVDICGEITVPEQNLADFYSNLLRGTSSDGVDGTVSDDGNVITINYEITFAAGNRQYQAVYTKNN